MNRLIITILITGLLTSCNNQTGKNDFYSYTRSGDLWRLPLAEPYELISPTNTPDGWFLVLKPHPTLHPDFMNSGDEFQLSAIDSAGISKSVIVLHSTNLYWPRLSGSFQSTLILDTASHNVWLYPDQQVEKIRTRLNELKVTAIRLLPIEPVIRQFQDSLKLPDEWRQ
jgi:hypothetical protein